MWEVKWSDRSVRQLKKLDKSLARRIVDHVEEIKIDLYIAVQRLVNSQFFKLRVGNYRVILRLHDDSATVFVVQIDPRKSDYKTQGRI